MQQILSFIGDSKSHQFLQCDETQAHILSNMQCKSVSASARIIFTCLKDIIFHPQIQIAFPIDQIQTKTYMLDLQGDYITSQTTAQNIVEQINKRISKYMDRNGQPVSIIKFSEDDMLYRNKLKLIWSTPVKFTCSDARFCKVIGANPNVEYETEGDDEEQTTNSMEFERCMFIQVAKTINIVSQTIQQHNLYDHDQWRQLLAKITVNFSPGSTVQTQSELAITFDTAKLAGGIDIQFCDETFQEMQMLQDGEYFKIELFLNESQQSIDSKAAVQQFQSQKNQKQADETAAIESEKQKKQEAKKWKDILQAIQGVSQTIENRDKFNENLEIIKRNAKEIKQVQKINTDLYQLYCDKFINWKRQMLTCDIVLTKIQLYNRNIDLTPVIGAQNELRQLAQKWQRMPTLKEFNEVNKDMKRADQIHQEMGEYLTPENPIPEGMEFKEIHFVGFEEGLKELKHEKSDIEEIRQEMQIKAKKVLKLKEFNDGSTLIPTNQAPNENPDMLDVQDALEKQQRQTIKQAQNQGNKFQNSVINQYKPKQGQEDYTQKGRDQLEIDYQRYNEERAQDPENKPYKRSYRIPISQETKQQMKQRKEQQQEEEDARDPEMYIGEKRKQVEKANLQRFIQQHGPEVQTRNRYRNLEGLQQINEQEQQQQQIQFGVQSEEEIEQIIQKVPARKLVLQNPYEAEKLDPYKNAPGSQVYYKQQQALYDQQLAQKIDGQEPEESDETVIKREFANLHKIVDRDADQLVNELQDYHADDDIMSDDQQEIKAAHQQMQQGLNEGRGAIGDDPRYGQLFEPDKQLK